VHWCAHNYVSSWRGVLTAKWSLLFEIKASSIARMLNVEEFTDGQILNEETLAVEFNQLNAQDRQAFMESLMGNNYSSLQISESYESRIFSTNVQEIITMICSVLGYDSGKVMDSYTLGILRAICPPTIQLMTRFFFSHFIDDSLHEQLNDFSLNIVCRFQSYLVFLFLFYRVNNFQGLNLEVEDTVGQHFSVIHWTYLVRKKPQNVGFINYVNIFMSISYSWFHEDLPPRIFPKIKVIFHDSSETKLGDWFLV